MNSWLLSYRRVNERKVENYVGFAHLACVRILLRCYFWDEFLISALGVAIARTLPGFGMIARDDVAEVMVQALLQPEAKNKIAEIINAPDAGPADRPGLFADVASG